MSIVKTNNIDISSVSLIGLRGLSKYIQSKMPYAEKMFQENENLYHLLIYHLRTDPEWTMKRIDEGMVSGEIKFSRANIRVNLKYRSSEDRTIGGYLDVCDLVREGMNTDTSIEDIQKTVLKWILATLCSKKSIFKMQIDGYEYDILDYVDLESL